MSVKNFSKVKVYEWRWGGWVNDGGGWGDG